MIDLRLILLLILSLKECSACGAIKCVTEFYPNKLGTMGRAARCKACDSRVKKNRHRMKKLRMATVPGCRPMTLSELEAE